MTSASLEVARARLDAFLEKAGSHYSTQRNFDRGPGQHGSVSGLAPYLRHRIISESEVLGAVLDQHSLSTAEKFVQEVYWRTYWKGWLEHRPGVWTRYLENVEAALLETTTNKGLVKAYELAQKGLTGIEPFDNWARELVETGYLHNHSRMWFASIWIFTLKLPWALGADFFLRHLLDGDPASNTLSWRWVAGLHTPGKTYLATANNIEKYASARFFSAGAPEGLGSLASTAVALVEEDLPPAVPPAIPLALLETAGSTRGCGLLLTVEDLQLDVPATPRTVALWMSSTRQPLPLSEHVQTFKADAGQDALDRARVLWPEADVVPAMNSVVAIGQWVEQQRLQLVFMAYLPQSYLRAQQAELEQVLAEKGCELRVFVREYDRVAWPHASKGFFRLKKQIPNMLEALRLI